MGNKYVVSLLIILAASIGSKLIEYIFSHYLQKFAKKTKTKMDDLIFERTRRPLSVLILAYGIKLSLLNLWDTSHIGTLVNSIMAAVFVFILARIFEVIVEVWGTLLAAKTKTNVDNVLIPVIQKAAKIVFVIAGILWILNLWNFNIAPYLAGAGIAGLVFGMALQDTLKNVFGGISLILDKNFNIDDPVRLEDGQIGTVREIGLRSTKILSYDHEVVFVPNGKLANMMIRNYKKPNDNVRKIVSFGVEYGNNPDRVKSVVKTALMKIEGINAEPELDVIFIEMGDSSLQFKARFWVDWDDAYAKWLEATKVVYMALKKNKIGIAFPTRTVHLVKK